MRKQRKGEWVEMGGSPGEIAHCTRCGEGLRLNMPQRVEIFAAASKAFVKVHSDCPLGQYIEKPSTTPEAWAVGRDTGTSSLTIWSAITGNPTPHRDYDVPHDPADFGRCYRLLALFPTWRGQLSKTIAICPKWEPFVEHWDELAHQYAEELTLGSGPEYILYNRIKELGG